MESLVRTDVPDELFAEALRSIERIEKEIRGEGGKPFKDGTVTKAPLNAPKDTAGDLNELLDMLGAGASDASCGRREPP